MENGKVRLNKYLAGQGKCSRREADRLIQNGKVFVNGEPCSSPAVRVSPSDNVRIADGAMEKKSYIALNKPSGYVVSTNPDEGEPVYSLIKGCSAEGLAPVGRLDKESGGLLLFSNDGRFTTQVINSDKDVEKEYYVKVNKPIDDAALEVMREGMLIDGKPIKSAKIKRKGASSFFITLSEGRNRQIRKMCRSTGYSVRTLIRIRVGSVHLADLKSGEWRELTTRELQSFFGN